jgi:endonuclease-3
VTKRLGWADGDYDKVSSTLAQLFRGRELEAHMYLILFGRRICKSRNPKCNECPLKEMCKSFRQEVVGQRLP